MSQFVLCLTLCHFVLAFFSPFGVAIASLGEERAGLGAFRAFVRFVFVWIFRFSLPLVSGGGGGGGGVRGFGLWLWRCLSCSLTFFR